MTTTTTTLAQPLNVECIQGAFIGPAKQKLGNLITQGYRINGFAIARDIEGADPQRGFITVDGLVGWWTPGLQALERAHEAMEKLRERCEQAEAAIDAARAVELERDELRRWKSTNAPRIEALEGLLADSQMVAANGREAIRSLRSEREANAILTQENEALRTQAEELTRDCGRQASKITDLIERLEDAAMALTHQGATPEKEAALNAARQALLDGIFAPSDPPPLTTPDMDLLVNRAHAYVRQARPAIPEGHVLVKSPISSEMHIAACKALLRSSGLHGTPQRMLDALIAASLSPERGTSG